MSRPPSLSFWKAGRVGAMQAAWYGVSSDDHPMVIFFYDSTAGMWWTVADCERPLKILLPDLEICHVEGGPTQTIQLMLAPADEVMIMMAARDISEM